MKNKQKGTLIVGIILILTIGVFLIKRALTPAGLNWASPLDVLLLSPTYPFWMLLAKYPKAPVWLNTVLVYGTTTIFWLAVGYFIGARMDKKK